MLWQHWDHLEAKLENVNTNERNERARKKASINMLLIKSIVSNDTVGGGGGGNHAIP